MTSAEALAAETGHLACADYPTLVAALADARASSG